MTHQFVAAERAGDCVSKSAWRELFRHSERHSGRRVPPRSSRVGDALVHDAGIDVEHRSRCLARRQ
jgi:hypothetical protein